MGKLCTMLLSIFGIPIQMAFLSVVGEVINLTIDNLLIKFEIKVLKRAVMKNLSKKRFLATIMLSIMTWMLWALHIKWQYEDSKFLDCIYFIFQILTTIGYGDMNFHATTHLYDVLPTAITATVAMGTTASLISSACKCIQRTNIRQAIHRVSFARRKSWSLSNEKCKDEQPKQENEMFKFN